MKYSDTIEQSNRQHLNLVLLTAEDMETNKHRLNHTMYKEGNKLFYNNEKSITGYKFHKLMSLCINYEEEIF